jgi:hypothetical protein
MVLCFACVFADIEAMDDGRSYTKDLGCRWKESLDVLYVMGPNNVSINCDLQHLRLKELTDSCPPAFIAGGANVASACLEVVFENGKSIVVPVESTLNEAIKGKNGELLVKRRKLGCFTTAVLEKKKTTFGESEEDGYTYSPITYESRKVLDSAIDSIFPKIDMKTNLIKTEGNPKYNYRDTEFQIVLELFGNSNFTFGDRIYVSRSTEGKDGKDPVLIILHIHTVLDPCAVCAEMLQKLAYTMNSFPIRLLLGKSGNQWLKERLQAKTTKFFVEISSERSYLNSRDCAFNLDASYKDPLIFTPETEWLLPTSKTMALSTSTKAPVQKTSVPLVVFRRLDGIDRFILGSQSKSKDSKLSSSCIFPKNITDMTLKPNYGPIAQFVRDNPIKREVVQSVTFTNNDAAGDGDCGYHALDQDNNDRITSRDCSNGLPSNSRTKAAKALIACLGGKDDSTRQGVIRCIAYDVRDRMDLLDLLFLEKDRHLANEIKKAKEKRDNIAAEESSIRAQAIKKYEEINKANIQPSRDTGYSEEVCKEGSDLRDRIWDYIEAEAKKSENCSYEGLLAFHREAEQNLNKISQKELELCNNRDVCLAYVEAFVKPSVEEFSAREEEALKGYFPGGNQLEISPNHEGVADAIALLQGKKLTVIQGDTSYSDQGTILRGSIGDEKNTVYIVNQGGGHYSKATEIRKK